MKVRNPLHRNLVSAGALAFGFLACSVSRADDAYTVSVDAPSARVGAASTVKVHIKPGAGRHINKEYPTSVKLTAPGGIQLAKSSVSAKDGGKVEESEAWIDVAYTPTEAGKKSFTGIVSFAVCTANTCDPRKAPLQFDVDVK